MFWKDNPGDLYNIDTQEQTTEPIKKTEVEVGVEKVKNGKAAGKDEVTG